MTSLTRSLPTSLALACALMLTACDGAAVPVESSATAAVTASAPDAAPVVLLDGAEKSLVIVGYSTSYAWPQMLQEMLDEHAGGERTYHVLNAVIGGSPVGRWIAAPDSEDYGDTYGAMLADFFGPDARLRGEAPAPTVAVLQHSLQRTPTRETRLGPVRSADDAEGIEIGADALEKLAMQLHTDGIERVYMAMHIYKEGYEPEVGNERFALAALLRRGHGFIEAGPDLWSLTIARHPEVFTEDRLHPNDQGSQLMAEAWYRTLAGAEAKQEVIDAMNSRSYDFDTLMNEYLEWRAGDHGAS